MNIISDQLTTMDSFLVNHSSKTETLNFIHNHSLSNSLKP